MFNKIVPRSYLKLDPRVTYGLLEYCRGFDAETVNVTTLVRTAIDPLAGEGEQSIVPFSLGGVIKANILYAPDASKPLLQQLAGGRVQDASPAGIELNNAMPNVLKNLPTQG